MLAITADLRGPSSEMTMGHRHRGGTDDGCCLPAGISVRAYPVVATMETDAPDSRGSTCTKNLRSALVPNRQSHKCATVVVDLHFGVSVREASHAGARSSCSPPRLIRQAPHDRGSVPPT